MINRFLSKLSSYKEVFFQLGLHLLVFFSYSYDQFHPQIDTQHLVFFLNYAFAAFFINYFLLSRFFYKKEYLHFFLLTVIVMGIVILVEELILEQIFFPDSRGRSFPGVFFSLLEVLPIIVILCGVKFGWDAISKQKELDQLKSAIKESELQFLTSQINPHFLFNNLNNLYSHAIESSPKTPEIILELSAVLRYMLYECKSAFVPLRKEIEHLENFTQLSQLQIEERGEVSFSFEGNATEFQIAPLILIVFIENAFKHSQASLTDNIRIDIRLSISPQGLLEFFCSNNFLPVSNTDNLSKGIGLENVRKRLELLYPDQYELVIQTGETEYEVYLALKLQKLLKG